LSLLKSSKPKVVKQLNFKFKLKNKVRSAEEAECENVTPELIAKMTDAP
jgi:hypothetical protein